MPIPFLIYISRLVEAQCICLRQIHEALDVGTVADLPQLVVAHPHRLERAQAEDRRDQAVVVRVADRAGRLRHEPTRVVAHDARRGQRRGDSHVLLAAGTLACAPWLETRGNGRPHEGQVGVDVALRSVLDCTVFVVAGAVEDHALDYRFASRRDCAGALTEVARADAGGVVPAWALSALPAIR